MSSLTAAEVVSRVRERERMMGWGLLGRFQASAPRVAFMWSARRKIVSWSLEGAGLIVAERPFDCQMQAQFRSRRNRSDVKQWDFSSRLVGSSTGAGDNMCQE